MNTIIGIILILFCCFVSLLSILHKKQNLLFTFIIFVLFSIWMYTKDYLHIPDGINYSRNFDSIDVSRGLIKCYSNIDGFEPGYMTLAFLVKYLGGNHNIFLFVVSILNEILILVASKILLIDLYDKKKEVPCSFILSVYYGYVGFFYNAIVLRAGLAISFLYLGTVLLYKKNYIWVAILFIISILFHKSAVIYIFFIIILNLVKIKKDVDFKIWWLIILGLWLLRIGYILRTFIESSISRIGGVGGILAHYALVGYGKHYMGDGFYSKKNIMYLLIGLLFVTNQIDYKYKKIYDYFLKIYLLGLTIMYLLITFSEGYRISDLFLISIVPLSVISLKHSKKYAKDIKILLSNIIIFLQFIITFRIIALA